MYQQNYQYSDNLNFKQYHKAICLTYFNYVALKFNREENIVYAKEQRNLYRDQVTNCPGANVWLGNMQIKLSCIDQITKHKIIKNWGKFYVDLIEMHLQKHGDNYECRIPTFDIFCKTFYEITQEKNNWKEEISVFFVDMIQYFNNNLSQV